MDTSRYTSLVEKRQAQMTCGMALFLVVFIMIFLGISRDASTGLSFWQRIHTDTILAISIPSFFILSLVSIVLTRYGYARLAGVCLVFSGAIGFGPHVIGQGLYDTSVGVLLAIMIVTGGLLLRTPGLVLGLVISIAILLLGIAQRADVPPPTAIDSTGQVFDVASSLLIIAVLIYLFLRYVQISRTEGMQEALQEHFRSTDIASGLNQLVAQRIAMDDLLTEIVTRVAAAFPEIYHVQVFLIDSLGKQAQLVASTGEAGQQLIARRHALAVGTLSVIGQVTLRGEPW
jgi:membrane-associated HD superfamily phosphohydrolase